VATEKCSARQALVLASGAGEVLPARPEGSSVTIKVGGPFLQCPITVAEGLFDPSQGAPEWTSPHRHHQFTEMTYALEGDMTFLLGEDLHRVEAGAFICVPPEVIHAYPPRVTARRASCSSRCLEGLRVCLRRRGACRLMPTHGSSGVP
jgi:mannose-6-phosphate isomerase-like protein (cupin superfamily)